METSELLSAIGFFFLGCVCWFISTLSGGGSSLSFVGFSSLFFSPHVVAPVSALASLIASVYRSNRLHKEVIWKIVMYATPGSIIGILWGGKLFHEFDDRSLRLAIVVLFTAHLLLTYKVISFPKNIGASRSLWWFIPSSLAKGFVSTMIGGAGPLLNPLYLKFQVLKERMIGTKAVVSLATDLFKLLIYGGLGYLAWETVQDGLFAGIGAILGCSFGHFALRKWITKELFVHFANALIALYAIVNLSKVFTA